MANQICVKKVERSQTRKLPFLPRIGVSIEIGGRQLVYRSAPLLETLLNLAERGFSQKNMMQIGLEELNEINLPPVVANPECAPELSSDESEG